MNTDLGPRVIFIIGWGRSGSTLIGNALAELQGCVHVGEVHDLWSAHASGFECGCGLSLPDCPFWREVAAADPLVAQALQGLTLDVHRLKQSHMRVRYVWRILRKGLSASGYQAQLQSYADLTTRLFRAVARTANAGTVVDSTKSPAAAALLLRTPMDVGFLHLVRDPRATGYSWQRRKESDLAGTRHMVRLGYGQNAAQWTYWNGMAEVIRRHVDPARWLRLRYEDFATAPEESLRHIANFFRLSTVNWPLKGRELTLGLHHTVEGNPSRFKTGSRPVASDDEWRRRMPGWARLLTVASTAPLLVAYGYRICSQPVAPLSR